MSRLDTRDAQDNVWTRGVHKPSRTVPPEEVTTFNLVRRLAWLRRASGGLTIALHSRPLEGGHRTSGRAASGADLELAVEVAPGSWIDLALQAKKFNPTTGKYNGWDRGQNKKLINWAQGNGRRAAGMLLYNSSDPPFGPLGNASPVFNFCCSDTVCHGWRWPRWLLPDGRSPLAVSLILNVSDPRVAQLTNPTPQRIADLALPWECLFCPKAQRRALGTMIGPRPAWIEPMQGPPGDEQPSTDARPQEASYSLALGMSDEERDEYHDEVAER
jgi:hypothetical protein